MLNEKMLIELKDYVEKHFNPPIMLTQMRSKSIPDCCEECKLDSMAYPVCESQVDIADFVKEHKSKETFSTKLLKYIDVKNVADSDIYKAAGIDRRHFSKIRSKKDYKPSKQTVLALCLALELNYDDMDDLLELAGYSLSTSETTDLVIMFCLKRNIYDLIDINELLDYMGCKALN